jgi:hypothetical protein
MVVDRLLSRCERLPGATFAPIQRFALLNFEAAAEPLALCPSEDATHQPNPVTSEKRNYHEEKQARQDNQKMTLAHNLKHAVQGNQGGRADNSLRGKSLQRALGGKPPKTLTPHEWELWYAQHGIPDEHLQPLPATTPSKWWRRLLLRWRDRS